MGENFTYINNIKCYAPDLANENSEYPKDVFKILFKAESTNFWFVSRNKIIQGLFRKYLGKQTSKVLELGCGTGYVLKGLQETFSNYELVGSEIHLEGIKFAKERLPNVNFIQLDATKIPFENQYDAIGAFDVLEHIDEDELVIQQVHKALKEGGLFFISVPQYQWMWSINDDIAYHKRRYSRKELKEKLSNSGFEVIYISSFVFMLFPFMYFSRLFKANKSNEITDEIIIKEMNELQLNPLLNKLFTLFMSIDVFFIRYKISLPFGGSLISVARKK